MFDTIGKPTYPLPEVVVNLSWQFYSDFVLWLKTVSHNKLDTEVYDLHPADSVLTTLHSADEDAVSWLTNYGKWHAYEKKSTTTAATTTTTTYMGAWHFQQNTKIASYHLLAVLSACALVWLLTVPSFVCYWMAPSYEYEGAFSYSNISSHLFTSLAKNTYSLACNVGMGVTVNLLTGINCIGADVNIGASALT